MIRLKEDKWHNRWHIDIESLKEVWLTLSERIKEIFINESVCGEQIMKNLENDSKEFGC